MRPYTGVPSIDRTHGNVAPVDPARAMPYGPGAGRNPLARGAFGVSAGFGG